jgi:hypothetical protein
MFDTWQDAQQKLSGTVIFINKQPVYVRSVEPQGRSAVIQYSLWANIGGMEVLNMDLYSPEVDYKSMAQRLGYANVVGPGDRKKAAIFLTRIPTRHSIQGLNDSNVRVTSVNSPTYLPRFNALLGTAWLGDMFQGKYPTFAEVCEDLREDRLCHARAFDPDFCIRKSTVGVSYLSYQDKDVGYSTNLKSFILGDQYKHLEETLEWKGLKIAG